MGSLEPLSERGRIRERLSAVWMYSTADESHYSILRKSKRVQNVFSKITGFLDVPQIYHFIKLQTS